MQLPRNSRYKALLGCSLLFSITKRSATSRCENSYPHIASDWGSKEIVPHQRKMKLFIIWSVPHVFKNSPFQGRFKYPLPTTTPTKTLSGHQRGNNVSDPPQKNALCWHMLSNFTNSIVYIRGPCYQPWCQTNLAVGKHPRHFGSIYLFAVCRTPFGRVFGGLEGGFPHAMGGAQLLKLFFLPQTLKTPEIPKIDVFDSATTQKNQTAPLKHVLHPMYVFSAMDFEIYVGRALGASPHHKLWGTRLPLGERAQVLRQAVWLVRRHLAAGRASCYGERRRTGAVRSFPLAANTVQGGWPGHAQRCSCSSWCCTARSPGSNACERRCAAVQGTRNVLDGLFPTTSRRGTGALPHTPTGYNEHRPQNVLGSAVAVALPLEWGAGQPVGCAGSTMCPSAAAAGSWVGTSATAARRAMRGTRQ